MLATVAPQVANDVRSEAAKRIVELAGSKFSKVFFTNGGADGVENAIRMARLSYRTPQDSLFLSVLSRQYLRSHLGYRRSAPLAQ